MVSGINIPPKPELLTALHDEIEKKHIDLKKVAALIGRDVAISASVLKTINSAFFGLDNKVVSISHAISLLGTKPTINLVSGFLLKQSLSNQNIEFPRFWDSSTHVALSCAFIASRLKLMGPDEPYILGLFHDIGIPLLTSLYSNFKETLAKENNSEGGIFTDEEDRLYATNHSLVGGFVSHEWRVSEPVIEAILVHHNPSEAFGEGDDLEKSVPKLVAILKIAEMIDCMIRDGKPDNEWNRFEQGVRQCLSLDENDISSLVEETKTMLATENR